MDTEYDTIAMVKASDKMEKKYLGLGVDSGGNLYNQTICNINLNLKLYIHIYACMLHECICMCVLCMHVQYAYALACNQEFIMLAHRECCRVWNPKTHSHKYQFNTSRCQQSLIFFTSYV